MTESIRLVRLTADYRSMRRFYEEQLNMRPLAEWDRGEYDKGVILVFNGRTSTTSVEILTQETGRPAAHGVTDHISLSFEVTNVGASYEEVKSRGVRIEDEPENKPWGHRAFTVRDPDGLLITFYQDMNRPQTENA